MMTQRTTTTTIVLSSVAVALLATAAPQAQDRPADAQRRRNQIQLLEGVLARAVGLGAEEVGGQMRQLDPTMTVLTGRARARGFVLEGYGVFFDVEIPGLRQSAVWAMMTVQRDMQVARAVESMRRALDQEPAAGQRLQAEFQNLQRVVGPLQAKAMAPAAPPPAAVPQAAPPAGEVAAAAETRLLADPRPAIPTALIDDPNAHYTEAVKRHLVDAMLDHGVPVDLGADEWLTVAARDSEGPSVPGEIYDAQTIILRVKGSDLAAYAADRSRRDEIRRKVLVSVF